MQYDRRLLITRLGELVAVAAGFGLSQAEIVAALECALRNERDLLKQQQSPAKAA